MTLTRRSLIGGLFCAAAAPAIVRISSLMRVRAPGLIYFTSQDQYLPGELEQKFAACWDSWVAERAPNGDWRVVDYYCGAKRVRLLPNPTPSA
jgi:hypothetical protein